MSAPLRKGWCPGALRPMPAKDGLLVRLRITGGILAAETAQRLADLAESFGNRTFDLSSRGNLQMRGIREGALPKLQGGLSALALIDRNAAGEAVRNVISSPLAGLHGGPNIRLLTAALEQRLATDHKLYELPPKFGFLIDDGSTPSLADVDADVRFDWTGAVFSIGLGGTRHEATRIGTCRADDAVDRAADIAQRALRWFANHPDARRGCDIVNALGTEAATRLFGGQIQDQLTSISPPRMRDIVGFHVITGKRSYEPASGDLPLLGLAAPFGKVDTAMIRAAASLAAATPYRELRLTPWRTMLVPGATDRTTSPVGFIIDPDDPRLAAEACIGFDGCARASTHTRLDAARLAVDLGLRSADGVALHVSGCAKGCAKATPAPITLVARDGRYDLVRHGRASDPPWRTGLALADVRETLASMTKPI